MRDEVADVAQLGPDLLPGRVYSSLASVTLHEYNTFENSSIVDEMGADGNAVGGVCHRIRHMRRSLSLHVAKQSMNKCGQAEKTSLFRDNADTFLI